MYPPIKYTYSKPIAISLSIAMPSLTVLPFLGVNDWHEFWHRDTGTVVFFCGYMLLFGVLSIYVIIGLLVPALIEKAVVIINETGVYSQDWGNIPWSSIDEITKHTDTGRNSGSIRAKLLLFKDAAPSTGYSTKKRRIASPLELIIPLRPLAGDSDKLFDQIFNYFNYYRQH